MANWAQERAAWWSMAWSLLAGSALLSGGCSSRAGSSDDEPTRDLGHIARAYQVHLYGGKPPREVDQLKKILEELHAANLNPAPEEVLTSSRDGQPYVIIMGANLGATTSGDILAYEKNGANGKRYVLLMSRDIRQMADEEFKRATFVQGHKPEIGQPAS
jgi:hypothetical protein